MSTQDQRNRLRRRTSGDPEDPGFVQLSSLVDPSLPIANPCGALKTLNGAKPLRCTREAGHPGDDGIHYYGQLVIRWSR
jgi:hypothetical protein